MDRAVKILLVLIINTWMARQFGPEHFGLWSFVIAFISIFQVAATLNFERILVRDLSIKPDSSARLLGTALALRLGAGLLCWLVAFLFVSFTHSGEDQLILLVAVLGSSLLFQASDIIDALFQSQAIIRYSVFARMISSLVGFAIKIALLLYGAPLLAFALTISLEFILGAICLVYFMHYRKLHFGWVFDAAIAKQLMRDCWPFMLAGIANILYLRIDQFMIAPVLGDTELGFYAAAVPVATVWHIIPMAFIWALAPHFASMKVDTPALYEQNLYFLFKFFMIIALLVCGFIYGLSDFFITLLYGPQYAASSSVLKIFIWTNYPIYMGIIQSLWITNENKPRIILIQTLLGCAISFVLTSYLLGVWGVEGAAVAAVISHFIASIFSNLYFAPQIFLMQIGCCKFFSAKVAYHE